MKILIEYIVLLPFLCFVAFVLREIPFWIIAASALVTASLAAGLLLAVP